MFYSRDPDPYLIWNLISERQILNVLTYWNIMNCSQMTSLFHLHQKLKNYNEVHGNLCNWIKCIESLTAGDIGVLGAVEGGICCGIVKTAPEASIGLGTVEGAQLVTEATLTGGGGGEGEAKRYSIVRAQNTCTHTYTQTY